MTEDGVTMEEMCETIVKADFLRKKDGTAPSAKEIFEYSPTGELGNVFVWYQTALEILKGNVTGDYRTSWSNPNPDPLADIEAVIREMPPIFKERTRRFMGIRRNW